MEFAEIPDDVRRYVIQCVPSVPYLEAALLLRENRGQAWQAGQVARRLYLAEPDAQRILDKLRQAGVIAETDSAYQYAPRTQDLSEVWDRVAATYSQQLVAMSTLIHSKSSMKAQVLAEAFVWRKGK